MNVNKMKLKRLETFVEKNITRASTSGMAKVVENTRKMERIDKPMLDEVLTFNLALIVIQVMTLCIYVI